MSRGRTPGVRRVLTPESVNDEMRREAALDMLIKGHKQIEIAQQLGVTQPTVSKWVRKALRDHQRRNVDEYRNLEDQRLDKLAAILWKRVERQGDAQAMQAAQVLVRVMDRRAKLHGLDAGAAVTSASIGAGKHAGLMFGTDDAESDVMRAALAAFAETFHRLAPHAILVLRGYPHQWLLAFLRGPSDPAFQSLVEQVDRVRAAGEMPSPVAPPLSPARAIMAGDHLVGRVDERGEVVDGTASE